MSAMTQREFDYDPFSLEVMQNPLPYYKVMRREHPIFYSAKYDAFFFSRFEHMLEMLSYVDNTFLMTESSQPRPDDILRRNNGAPAIRPLEPFPGSPLIGNPIHGEMRKAHIRPLLPGSVERLIDLVHGLANARLDVLLPKGRFNLTRDYGGLISASVIMHLMGMPLELAEKALDIVNSGTRTDPESGGFDTIAVVGQCIELSLPYIQARFDAGADGTVPVIDGLIRYQYNGRALTPVEVAQAAVCVLIGGTETVPKVVSHGLMELNSRPDQMAAVRENLAENVPKASEEMIRFCGPAQWFMRTVHKPVTIGGQRLEPGQRAFFMVASANRDEAEYENPDEFQWNRGIRRTLAFGHGMHFCIGVHLARMEVRVMVDTFLKRVPKFKFDMTEAVRPPSSFQWGWNILPVVVES